MNKQTIITALLALVVMAGQAQEIKMNEASFSDYLPLLNAKGYMAYSFDVSAIKGKNVMFNIREYANGKEVEDSTHEFLFPYTFTANGEKLVVGFLPSEKDSLALCCFSWENTLSFTTSLKLRQIYWESENKYVYSYTSKPFELTMPLEADTVIPLVCYCSFWYDAEYKVTRCCGENFIKPDLSSDILKYVPHYYVLGIQYY